MAKIVFAWELGAGLGHIVPYIRLVDALKSKGHEAIFIVRDLASAVPILGRYNVPCFQAPVKISPSSAPVRVPCTYAHVLYNSGFDGIESLSGRVQGWRSIFDVLNPDLVIFDHSPSALLSARGYTFKKIIMGTGFVIPPPVYPLPNLRFWLKTDIERLHRDEDNILKIINSVLAKFRIKQLDMIAELFMTGPNILRTYKEFDPYKAERNGTYWGISRDAIGETPLWPDVPGKRIFVYLKPFPALQHLLSLLENLKTPSIVYIDGPRDRLREKFNSASLRFVNRPQDMTEIVSQCDLAIVNGNHNTTMRLLLAGKSILNLPLHLEQYLTACAVDTLGAGMSAPTLKPDEISAKLEMLMRSDSYAEAAQKFSASHSDIESAEQDMRLLNFVEGMLE